MTDDLKNRRFKIEIFIIAFLAISMLTGFSFLAAWGRDESTLGNGLILNLLADSYFFFRQPTHGIFWESITNNGGLFLPLLTVNIFFWAILTERIITLTTKRIRNYRLKSNAR
jgi:hypothetical protein